MYFKMHYITKETVVFLEFGNPQKTIEKTIVGKN